MRLGVLAVAVLGVGCSFGIKTRTTPQASEPDCSESMVRPGFDGTMAVSAALGAGLAALDLKHEGCGDAPDMYGYRSNPTCATYGWMIGTTAAAAVAFTAAAIYGSSKAGQCERDQDAYDRMPQSLAPVRTAKSSLWPPEVVAACEAERSALVANATSENERRELESDMVCGPVIPPIPRKRYRGRSAKGIMAGFIVGTISVGLGALIFADSKP